MLVYSIIYISEILKRGPTLPFVQCYDIYIVSLIWLLHLLFVCHCYSVSMGQIAIFFFDCKNITIFIGLTHFIYQIILIQIC